MSTVIPLKNKKSLVIKTQPTGTFFAMYCQNGEVGAEGNFQVLAGKSFMSFARAKKWGEKINL